jgi:DNA invertase Pin-like site-specific DNA recombinase
MQLNAVREFISRHGWENAGEYVDEGWSGAKAEQTTIRQANGGCGKAAV